MKDSSLRNGHRSGLAIRKSHSVALSYCGGAKARSVGREAMLCARDDYATRVGGGAKARNVIKNIVFACKMESQDDKMFFTEGQVRFRHSKIPRASGATRVGGGAAIRLFLIEARDIGRA